MGFSAMYFATFGLGKQVFSISCCVYLRRTRLYTAPGRDTSVRDASSYCERTGAHRHGIMCCRILIRYLNDDGYILCYTCIQVCWPACGTQLDSVAVVGLTGAAPRARPTFSRPAVARAATTAKELKEQVHCRK
jgi:hypothetical protein